ncbi:MAG: 16S rRNA (cytidine(1402)-2'-O)-methyltransferase [Saprospiraceae bacterium]|nr:16S rRNA (cytidine(1402)-2'-O)-methyltransferase [Saprospiraceae bacterium]
MLYLVPTPIGNKGDMTSRAIEVLQSCDLILAEDTRVSKPFLKHLGIEKEVKSFHSHNEHRIQNNVIELLKSGKNIALISDAGTPGISDPAFLLVRACREAFIDVCALPGATAFVPALVASGLPADKFFFQGFLPQKKGRQTQLKWLATLPCTIIIYEAPHRVEKLLTECINTFGEERLACFVKEISKMFEKYICGTLAEIKVKLESEKILGEWVVIIGPTNNKREED